MGLLPLLTVVAPFGCAVHVAVCLFKESLWLLEAERGRGSLQARGEAVPAAWLYQTILALGWGDPPQTTDLIWLLWLCLELGWDNSLKPRPTGTPCLIPLAGSLGQAGRVAQCQILMVEDRQDAFGACERWLVPKEKICTPLKAEAQLWIYSVFPPDRKESVLIQFHAFQVGFRM